jgi:hypothetical protein
MKAHHIGFIVHPPYRETYLFSRLNIVANLGFLQISAVAQPNIFRLEKHNAGKLCGPSARDSKF